MRLYDVYSSDKVRMTVREAGRDQGPTLILIHGWSQHSLSWSRQLAGPLAEEFRLIAPDLRGHGASDKPDPASAYDNPAPWAADVAALVAFCEDPPILVGWSMGGRVIGDYLSVAGCDDIAGVVMVGASATSGALVPDGAADLRGPAATAIGTYDPDDAVALPAIVAFVEACASAPFAPKDLAMMVGLNMLCPAHVRKACRMRDYDHRAAYRALKKPAMVIHGADEALCVPPLFDQMVESLPTPQVHVYDNVGHMPFWEATTRFDADLAAFARQTMGVAA